MSNSGLAQVLSCVFDDNVLCPHRKSAKFVVMDRCFECPEYAEFVRVMEEDEFFAEVDEANRTGVHP